MLEISDLNVSYGPISVLKNLNFKVETGKLTVLLGPNGTGKSSLLKAVSGLIPMAGSVNLEKEVLKTARQRSDTIAYMPQDTGSGSSLTVIEVILLGRLKSLGLSVPASLQAEAKTILSRFGLTSLESRSLDELSGGQRQLVYLAQSLLRNPKVLLLDEPTAALDLKHQLLVLDKVVTHCKKNNTIGVAAMHDLTLAAKYADRIICLNNGNITADGNPRKILSKSLIRDLYCVEVEIQTNNSGVMHITPIQASEQIHFAEPLI